jgi:hypothetical protein
MYLKENSIRVIIRGITSSQYLRKLANLQKNLLWKKRKTVWLLSFGMSVEWGCSEVGIMN